MLCHYLYFKDVGYKFELHVCNKFLVLMTAYELKNTEILNVKGVDYGCILWGISKNETVNILNSSVLKDLGEIRGGLILYILTDGSSGISDTGWVQDVQTMRDSLIEWKGIASRFRGRFVKMIKDAHSKFDDHSISPKIRPTLLHWRYELTRKNFFY